MKLTAEISISKTIKQFEKLSERGQKAVTDSLWLGASMMRGTAQEAIKHGSKTGIKYKDLPNRSSAPGEAPATQSNNLADHIDVVQEQGGLIAKVVVRERYGFWLEFGTHTEKGDVWIAPRPFLMPAFRLWAPKINQLVKQAWKVG